MCDTLGPAGRQVSSGRKGGAVRASRVALCLAVLLALCLLGSGCGSAPATCRVRGSLPTALFGSLEAKSESGVGLSLNSPQPGGGLVVSTSSSGYAVTLIGGDGSHDSGTATLQGSDLLVTSGLTRFFLVRHAGTDQLLDGRRPGRLTRSHGGGHLAARYRRSAVHDAAMSRSRLARAQRRARERANKHIEQARTRLLPTMSGSPSCSCAPR